MRKGFINLSDISAKHNEVHRKSYQTPYYGTFSDRGDISSRDYTKSVLTIDDNWHDLDLSSIVPEGTTAVVIHIELEGDTAEKGIFLRKKGNINNINISQVVIQVANIYNFCDVIVPCDSNGKIEYAVDTGATYSYINLTVKGWF